MSEFESVIAQITGVLQECLTLSPSFYLKTSLTERPFVLLSSRAQAEGRAGAGGAEQSASGETAAG